MSIFHSLHKPAALMTAAALVTTACLFTFATAENAEKHFSIVEAASRENALSIPEIAKNCRTSVVAIETETTVVCGGHNSNSYSPFGSMFPGFGYGSPSGRSAQREYTKAGAGSGIILSEDGYILTNHHVISGADKITVYVMPEDPDAEETSYEAELIGSSESSDVAVLKIEAEKLNAAEFGDSDQLEIGELAVAIGNPMGNVHGSVTAGIISATEKELTIGDVTISAIQTDASINPGNSGGALFDSFGHVIGLVYAKSASVSVEGMGYAIPVNDIKELVDNMINNPDAVKAQKLGSQIMLGITISEISEEKSQQSGYPVGLYVTEVSSMSAAERAGLQRGDIITAFSDEPVATADDLNTLKAGHSSGDVVSMVVDRNGREVTLEIVMPQPTEVETAGK